MVRSAILYADSVELVSQMYQALTFADAVKGAARKVGEYITHPEYGVISRYLTNDDRYPRERDEIWPMLDEMLTRHRISPDLPENEFRRAIRDAYEIDWRQEAIERKQWSDSSGLTDLRRLIELGLVESVESGLNYSPGLRGFDPSAWQEGWQVEVQRRIEGGTRLIFDAKTQRLVRRQIASGVVRPSTIFDRRASNAAVGTGLIARLPSFPQAPLDELLELRRDLAAPLTRYRAASTLLAEKSGITVGTTSSEALDDLWAYEVRPSLEDIDEALLEHGLPRELARAAGKDIRRFLLEGAAIWMGISAWTDLASWAAGLAGIAAPAAQAFYNGWRSAKDGRLAAQHGGLFYLHEAHRRLDPRS
jgi:hypothetical protein